MAEDKYTLEGIPKLTREGVDVLFRDLDRRAQEGHSSEGDSWEEMQSRIARENPFLDYLFLRTIDYFQKHYGKDKSEKTPAGIIKEAQIFLWEAIRRQAETNKLEESFQEED